MAVTRKPGIGKMEDFISGGKPIVIGATPNTAMQHSAMLLKEMFGGHVKVVSGFKGTAEVRLAMRSGEVDGVITGWESLRVTNLKDFESGEWAILSQSVDEPLSDLPQKNVPLIYQFARAAKKNDNFSSWASSNRIATLGRMFCRWACRESACGPWRLRSRRRCAIRNCSPRRKSPSSISVRFPALSCATMIVEGLSIPVQLKQKLRPMLAPPG